MSYTKIEKIGNSAAIFLTSDILTLLGIEFGDEVELRVERQELVIKAKNEFFRNQIIDQVTDEVINRRKNVYKRLA